MRYYLGQTEYKWSHKHTNLELLWVRRQLGEELYKTVESNGWKWTLIRTQSNTLPDDIYCRCDIYVDSNDDKLDTHFTLKFPKAQPIPFAK